MYKIKTNLEKLRSLVRNIRNMALGGLLGDFLAPREIPTLLRSLRSLQAVWVLLHSRLFSPNADGYAEVEVEVFSACSDSLVSFEIPAMVVVVALAMLSAMINEASSNVSDGLSCSRERDMAEKDPTLLSLVQILTYTKGFWFDSVIAQRQKMLELHIIYTSHE